MRDITLDGKSTLESGRINLTGIQALVLLPMLQRRRGLADRLNTAGYVSGYRGCRSAVSIFSFGRHSSNFAPPRSLPTRRAG